MKNFLTILLFAIAGNINAQTNDSFQLSSHILDITKGTPASGVKVKLEKLGKDCDTWFFVEEKTTDANGRIGNFLKADKYNEGTYKLIFLVADYFKSSNTDSFYPFIEVVFEIKGDSHFHVPIVLSPYGYSTYKGS